MNLVEKLKNLRDVMKKEFKSFPHKCCREAVRRGCNLGLEETFGLFIDDGGLGNNHHWNKKDGRIYEITARQFSDSLPEIYILDENSEEAKARYVEGTYLMI